MCDPSGYRNASGTSMACPHTSGAAALIWKAHPEFANVDVRNILGKAAKDLGTPGRDIYFGFGRIDVKAAVDYVPPKRYKCTGAPDYQCVEDPNGPYIGIDACLAVCKPPRYRCTGAPDYKCVEDLNGPYASLDECLVACKPPRYRCTGAPDYQCVEDPNGPYASLNECLCVCKPPKRYRCENGTCVEDPNGPFDNIEECVANCWNKTWKWNCMSAKDANGNIVNTYCKPDLNGIYNTIEECQIECRKLRQSMK